MRTRSLKEYGSRDLAPLLEEECGHWGRELYWDFREVSAAVNASLERGALTGLVLEAGARPVAYCYYLADGERAVVGSLFSARQAREHGLEEQLLAAVIAEVQRSRRHGRVECQTLFSTAREPERLFTQAGFASRVRHYLVRSLSEAGGLAGPSPLRLRPLSRVDLRRAADIIHRSHIGSLDAALNLTYASGSACRNFVETLVLRAGCGRLSGNGSLVAEDERGRSVGVVLASYLSPTNGHLCQVSVLPEKQGHGVGVALVRASLRALQDEGMKTVTLSVTVDNRAAHGLYRRLGFRLRKSFGAHAWVRPPGRIHLPA